ncbi:hypothetical protein FISHEDRAFT_63265 [Fistulina hepatica ATCC 64428]|uniref:SH3 domain-containing protein n=1 Tax=Fistulina hepatica ATCC 64428 TaxID=1128425 RepID=A0A0D7AR43_9AGAR|nr:hypothetical protein FISHEDRAFT_63265 [Fistulina hepatica ATCC 64428]
MISDPAISLLISQTRQNVEFLISHNHISAADGREILAKLPVVDPVSALADRTSSIALSEPKMPSPPDSTYSLPIPPPSRTPNPSTPAPFPQARALWAYNENNTDPNDLSFREGDIIEIVAETNADWWTGRCGGKEGLFPSNYVDRLPPVAPKSGSLYLAPQPAYPAYNAPPPPNVYSPPPPQGYGPPPAPYGAPVLYQPPPPPQSVQEAPPPEEKKKNKFGKYGNTLAQAGVGGLGFGAGSAVGSGIVHAIF